MFKSLDVTFQNKIRKCKRPKKKVLYFKTTFENSKQCLKFQKKVQKFLISKEFVKM